jgi:hypothetical protein
MLNVGRSFGDHPLTISVLVRFAINAMTLHKFERFLAQVESDEATLERLQKALEQEAAEPLLLICARGERALGSEMVDHIKRNPAAARLAGIGSNKWYDAIMLRLPGLVNAQQAATLRHMNRFVAIADAKAEDQSDLFVKWEAEANNLPWMMTPGMAKVGEANRRSQANLRCAITAIAAERYRLKNTRWPAKLEDLVTAQLLKAVPLDPYDGQPLRWKECPDGRLVYSIGPDRVDNGGVYNRNSSPLKDSDIVFLLFGPAKRRSAPAPMKPKGEPPTEN